MGRGFIHIFFFFFNTCIVPLGFLPWKILVAFLRKSQLQQSHATQPKVHTGCFSVSMIHQTLTWATVFLKCTQMLMHVITHGGVQIPSESLHWKLTLGEKSLATPGNWPCVRGMPVQCSTSWATSPPYDGNISEKVVIEETQSFIRIASLQGFHCNIMHNTIQYVTNYLHSKEHWKIPTKNCLHKRSPFHRTFWKR